MYIRNIHLGMSIKERLLLIISSFFKYSHTDTMPKFRMMIFETSLYNFSSLNAHRMRFSTTALSATVFSAQKACTWYSTKNDYFKCWKLSWYHFFKKMPPMRYRFRDLNSNDLLLFRYAPKFFLYMFVVFYAGCKFAINMLECAFMYFLHIRKWNVMKNWA